MHTTTYFGINLILGKKNNNNKANIINNEADTDTFYLLFRSDIKANFWLSGVFAGFSF